MKLFQTLLNSYFHITRLAPDHLGLMPWSFDEKGQISNFDGARNSATDADEDIISTLIDAVAKDPNLTMTADGVTMKVSDLLKIAISNFTKLDCGSTNGLTGGSNSWTLGPGFTDYLDLTALTKMMTYCQQNGMSDQAGILKNAMNSMMSYVKTELNLTGKPEDFKLPSGQGDGSSAMARLLYRLTEFIASPLSKNSPLRKDAIAIVQNLLTKGFKSGAIQIAQSQWGTTIKMTAPGCTYTIGNAQASATLYLAMKLLNDQGLLPPELVSKLPAVKAAFDCDMNNQFNNLQQDTPSQYSNNGDYFGLTLGILCESLLKEYGS